MKCLFCGKEFEPTVTRSDAKYCSRKCRGRANVHLPQLKSKSRPKPTKSLDDWTREARACNLDYGTYRALIERGKTFDELFAERDKHSVPAHAHVHKWL